jgi:iron complex outermembrane recepter protein
LLRLTTWLLSAAGILAPMGPAAGHGAQPDDEEQDDEEDDGDEEVVEIRAQRPKEGATEEVVERTEIETFPHRDAGDLLRLSPGLHLSAHGGRGKAPQIFVRGFDAVHGSDVAVSLEGIPLNEATHVHGQGYLDLHFIPPEAVIGLELTKGAARADRGDFAIAASADYRVGLAEPGLRVGGGVGTDRSLRAMTAYRPLDAGPDTFVVGDAEWAEGVGEGRGHRSLRAMAGVGGDLGRGHLRWIGAVHDGRFDSPGVLRQDDLDAGRVALYDSYLERDGGVSRRLLTGIALDLPGEADRFQLLLYGGWRQLALTHNFTGAALHPDTGDARRQQQVALTWGATSTYRRGVQFARDATTFELGLALRGDHVDQSDHGLDRDDRPWITYAEAQVFQLNPAAWLRADVGLFSRVRLVPALRLDGFRWRVWDHVDDTGEGVADPEVAVAHAWTLSPKAAAEVVLARGWRGYLSYGRGFRSPPARELDDGDLAPLGKADTVEIGTHLTRVRWLDLRATFFLTFVGNEIVFDHLEARFLASGSTRRVGGELVVAAHPLPWLRLELDVTYARGRYTATDEPIPYAPGWLVAGGIFAGHAGSVARGSREGTRWSLSAGLRAWALGPRPLPEGLTSHAAFVTDLVAEASVGRFLVELQVDNLFDQRWRDGEFVFPSCFEPAGGCSALPSRHVTAGTPFAVRALVGVHL